ncbi:MAG: SDR family NAD(P)-dependent oxidoreductase [Acidibrevibacterium sp.]|jgi:NAD(P)-dependent dehydrogenase (short-subunit alcohol dehydrogenase family)|uniref:SDR family NAD(P)-dependent oxidoreductase n=1 Tax=Acidibrevibacterium fodinaquatile TaxID=1969806 RepID=UPI0023A8FE64|nr:SDR family NAD(P)-dependent oxidoreductase [Acidibrevibacterium fodinaquatile]MCA7118942.1 SDR family NAD(P)-dependent oxidoreductase [Acidibrevibacterium fodinaquatile]
MRFQSALIVGAGAGLSASLARQLAAQGTRVALAARNAEKLAPLAAEIGGMALACDAARPEAVAALFAETDRLGFAPDCVIYNPSRRLRGAIADLDPAAVAEVLAISAYGGFLVGQQAARRMLARGGGAIGFTGASASVKGYALSAPFAMGKFALRGLAQSMARELHPQGVHVVHLVIDGGIRSEHRPTPAEAPDSLLDPDAIAATYLAALQQPRSAWSLEVELRPWVERF